jgi:hypothetical protein
VGPRQSGKTTLAKTFIPDAMFDLENPVDFAALENPVLQLNKKRGLIVIDEIQRKHDLFPVLRFLCDTNPECKFCILGSASPDLMQKASESLAGRISYYVLLGFRKDDLTDELYEHHHFRGGFPRSLLAPDIAISNQWRKDYLQAYIERDIPQLGVKLAPHTVFKFCQMIAHYHGNIINYSEVGRSFGVADTTVRHYVEILTGTYIVRLLQPWYANIGKRLVKRPKIYIRDSGILHSLLMIDSMEALSRHPKVGASWEGYALEAVSRSIGKPDYETYFYSVHSGAELDLVWEHNGKMWGCEFKYSDAPVLTRSMQQAINDLHIEKAWVIYPGDRRYALANNIEVVPLRNIPPAWQY